MQIDLFAVGIFWVALLAQVSGASLYKTMRKKWCGMISIERRCSVMGGDVVGGFRRALLLVFLLATAQCTYICENGRSAALGGLSRGKHRVTIGGNTRGWVHDPARPPSVLAYDSINILLARHSTLLRRTPIEWHAGLGGSYSFGEHARSANHTDFIVFDDFWPSIPV